MTKRALATSLSAILAACGGGGDDGLDRDNPAADREFEYGPPASASSAEATVLHGALSYAVSLSGTPSASVAIALASITGVTGALLGPFIGAAGVDGGNGTSALTARFDEACISATRTSIVFDHCEISAGGSTTVTDGEFTFSEDGRTITWDLDITAETAFGGYTTEVSFHQSGELTVTGSTITGKMLAELRASSSGGGSTYTYAFSEALIVDLTYETSPLCITGGSLEARRVWTERPAGLASSTAPDEGVLIEWTGCNEATVRRSR